MNNRSKNCNDNYLFMDGKFTFKINIHIAKYAHWDTTQVHLLFHSICDKILYYFCGILVLIFVTEETFINDDSYWKNSFSSNFTQFYLFFFL